MKPFCFSKIESICSFQEVKNQSCQASFVCSDGIAGTRFTNNVTVVFNLEIFDIDGTLLASEYDMTPGYVTDWIYFPTGEIRNEVWTNAFNIGKEWRSI